MEEEQKNIKQKKNEKENEKGKKSLWIMLILIFIGIIIIITLVSRIIAINIGENPSPKTSDLYGEGRNPAKPIIYLYPLKEVDLTVKLRYPQKITCSYPEYENGWSVIAKPDGNLIETKSGRKLYSLYWEGKGTVKSNIKEGFVVKGEDSAKFLEEKLEILGLNDREAEEFIIYWLPKLESNKYNYIRFATLEEINEYMPLEFSVKPDSLIRILMQFKGLEKPVEVKEQKLHTPQRTGFVAVEWGGTELK